MKIKCSQTELANKIKIVLKAVPNRSTMPILECILIDASGDEIKLISNDFEMGIITLVCGEISEHGIVAVNAKMLNDIICKLPKDEVKIFSDNMNNVKITCGKSKFHISGQSGDDFTMPPEIAKENSVCVTQTDLRNAIMQTSFSLSFEGSNKIMSGEHMEKIGGKLRFTALDGHRIAQRIIPIKSGCDEDVKAIVPGLPLREIAKTITGGYEDDINIYFCKYHMVFELPETTIITRLVEGQYFAVEQMMKIEPNVTVKLANRDFADCIDRATLLIKEATKKPVILNFSDDGCELSAESAHGVFTENVEIKKYGEDLKIGFDPRYLLEVLKAIDDDEITLQMLNRKAPCVIKDNGTYNYLVLPVNITGGT